MDGIEIKTIPELTPLHYEYQHGITNYSCKDCGGQAVCEHNHQRTRCKECAGGGRCIHLRIRYQCKECGGSQICIHNRQRYFCRDCGGLGMCEHGRQRHFCKECSGKGIFFFSFKKKRIQYFETDPVKVDETTNYKELARKKPKLPTLYLLVWSI